MLMEQADPGGDAAPDHVRLLDEQLQGLARWHASPSTREEVVDLRGMNRELRIDLERRQMVRARQHQALVERSSALLEEGVQLLARLPTRVVVVHRREWLRGKLVAELTRLGLSVVAQLDDGADAVGVAVAEQPDLLFVEDPLPSMTALEVIAAVQEFCVRTRIAVQVEAQSQVPQVLSAGAAVAFTRRTPPVDMARDLAELVRTA